MHGLGNWLDTACTDPADESVVYTKENVFAMDWSRPPGREQSLAGLTLDRFKYPRDNRVAEGHGPAHRLINGVRRIDGKLFLYCGGQGTGSLEIYKFGEGCVAAPCGVRGRCLHLAPGNGKRWPEDAESFIWTDGNGDGVPDPGGVRLGGAETPLGLYAPGRRCRHLAVLGETGPSGTCLARGSTHAAIRSIAGPPRCPTRTRRSSPATGFGDSFTSPAMTY